MDEQKENDFNEDAEFNELVKENNKKAPKKKRVKKKSSSNKIKGYKKCLAPYIIKINLFFNKLMNLIKKRKKGRKQNNIAAVIAIIAIFAISVFILNIGKIFPDDGEIIVNNEEITENIGTELTGTTTYSDCSSEQGLNKGTVLFIYSNSCPHCTIMKPIVTGLESNGYDFYWVTSGDNKARTVISSCFQDVISSYVPQFICSSNGKSIVGERSKGDLKSFAESCR